MKIIIVSYEEDAHAQFVMKRLRRLGHSPLLLNIGGYPDNGDISLEISSGEKPSIALKFEGKKIEPEEIAGIWWRRPNGVYREKRETLLGKYIKNESEILSNSVMLLLENSHWISHPESMRFAGKKPIQLVKASALGFRIPISYIGNSQVEAAKFIRRMARKALTIKPVGSAFVRLSRTDKDDNERNKIIYTKIVSHAVLLKNIEMIDNCPIILQEAIIKDFDLRVTVIGNKVFTAAIHAEGCDDPTNLDWRNVEAKREYKSHKLPPEIESK